jgi:hypothetical protein
VQNTKINFASVSSFYGKNKCWSSQEQFEVNVNMTTDVTVIKLLYHHWRFNLRPPSFLCIKERHGVIKTWPVQLGKLSTEGEKISIYSAVSK